MCGRDHLLMVGTREGRCVIFLSVVDPAAGTAHTGEPPPPGHVERNTMMQQPSTNEYLPLHGTAWLVCWQISPYKKE